MHEPKSESGEFIVGADGVWLYRLEGGDLSTVSAMGAATDFGSIEAAEAAIEEYRKQGRHQDRQWRPMRVG